MNSRAPARAAGFNLASPNRRLLLWYAVVMAIIGVIIIRLFYVQIVRHDYYHKAALGDQLRQYTIAPERGIIEAHQDNNVVPIVLNEKLYTLYADPTLVKQPEQVAAKLVAITHGSLSQYSDSMKTKKTRYVVLAKRLNVSQSNKISALKLPGIGTQAQNYRTYPQSSLAAQLLGFVNNDGKGTYGVEQALNTQLSGKPGMLKAITDVNGVPLAASRDNVQINPTPGNNLVLTINLAMQQELENYLKADTQKAKSNSGSAVIMDPNTGAIMAMANYPTYDPSQYYNVNDASLFNNASVSTPFEVGSIMKTLTAASALDQGVVTTQTTYNDPGHWQLDGSTVKNVEEDGGPGPANLSRILNLSMNTGATWLLMQMGNKTGEVNQTSRDHWYDYLTKHYRFGQDTGIEQGYESPGYIPKPDSGYALQLTYANTSFGQAMTATPLQMAAALSAVLNGGKYYQPHLVDSQVASNGKTATTKPKVLQANVVSSKVSQTMQQLMAGVVQTKVQQGFPSMSFPNNYVVGGKTGTAQIADPQGGYYGDRFNGTFIGFVGGDKPQYVIMVTVKEPHVGGYAGTSAAMPLFADLAHMLINNFNVTPKSGS
jgi:cell division protein FtsI (penicillin-binding protein 3)